METEFDAPTAIARRSSSSYKHMHTNNLVSKSPFKTLAPTRRVSAEKRPRPPSMHDDAETENERPFALKRERRQSKTFQGLLQAEPVTKSPFRRVQPPPMPSTPTRIPVPVRQATVTRPSPSPGRSSLVSRRMHGPRLSSQRRERRKTVTFDERCDVVEFDRDDETEDDHIDRSIDSQDDHHDPDDEGEPVDDDSYSSIALSDIAFDPDVSITGLVDSMFSSAANPSPVFSTPPHHSDPAMPPDLDAESGVPYGRSHHRDRLHSAHAHHSPVHSPPTQIAFPSTEAITPPRHQDIPETPPLGRSTHIQRIRAARAEERAVEDDISMLPGSPSPAKTRTSGGMVPRFFVRGVSRDINQDSLAPDTDPFALPDLRDEPPLPFRQLADLSGESLDVAEVHKDSQRPEKDADEGDTSYSSCEETELPLIDVEPRGGSPASVIPTRIASPASSIPSRLASPPSAIPSRVSSPVNSVPMRTSPFASSIATHGNSPVQSISNTTRASSPAQHIQTRVDSPAQHTSSPLAKSGSSPTPAKSGPPQALLRLDTVQPLARSGSLGPRIDREAIKRRLIAKSASPESVDAAVDLPAQKVDDVLEERMQEQPHKAQPHPNQLHEEISITHQSQEDSSQLQPTDDSADPSRDAGSVMTEMSSVSVESAVIGVAEKRHVGETQTGLQMEFGTGAFTFQFGSQFGRKLGVSGADRVVGAKEEVSEAHIGAIEMDSVDVEMRSALDRLMDDVGAGMATPSQDKPFMPMDDFRFSTSATTSRNVSGASLPPPPVPPKDNIRSREEMILVKRREARRREEWEDMGWGTPPREAVIVNAEETPSRKLGADIGVGRPSRRRSRSTGDVVGERKKRGVDMGVGDDGGLLGRVGDAEILGEVIERELRKLEGREVKVKSKYYVREREGTIYASSSEADRIGHLEGTGDVNGGRAWRAVRRPSDMNEYSKQIKEYRAQEKPGKAHGKVFVRVLGIKNLNVPIPEQPTAITCTLNNGIHFVTTPECRVGVDCKIEQEFELIEHSKLEFTLTLKIRRDPHIIAQFKALTPPVSAPAPPPVAPTSSKGGMRGFFSSSPKKSKSKEKEKAPTPPTVPLPRLPENLARYLKSDGTLARAFIAFKDIAPRCDTRLFETSYPLIGQRVEMGTGKLAASAVQVGEIVLQMFRLPPLPGVGDALELPQSLEECCRGLRHVNWHKVTYFEGTLTQIGGDCSTWRRRQLRVIGASLVAFNDVTKKATATIDLRKALAVEDDQEARNEHLSPASGVAVRTRYADEYEYGVERSFRLLFPCDQEIVFFADTDEEKSRWLDVLRALVGHIPPNPLWAELLWQRQEELAKRPRQNGSSALRSPLTQDTSSHSGH